MNAADKCAAQGCDHERRDHRVEGVAFCDHSYCRTCFDVHPSDDSMVEGGVYHAFVEAA